MDWVLAGNFGTLTVLGENGTFIGLRMKFCYMDDNEQ